MQEALNAVLPELEAECAGVTQALRNHSPGDVVGSGCTAAIIDPQPRHVVRQERIGMVNHGNRFFHHAAFIESIIRHGINQWQVADVSGYQVFAGEIMLKVLSVRFV